MITRILSLALLVTASTSCLARGGADDVIGAPSSSVARGGEDRGGGRDNTFKGTQAGFLTEAVEHSVRLLNATQLSQVNAAEATLGANQTIRVVLTLDANQNLAFNCAVVDDSSRGGTIIKKDVRCALAQ